MRPIKIAVGPLAAAAVDNIALSQIPAASAPFVLNGVLAVAGVAILDTPRRVLLSFGNELSARTVVLAGTNWSGQTISETLAVASGSPSTIASVLDYATVTSAISGGGQWSAAASIGTNGIAGSPWVQLDEWAFPQVAVQCDVVGTVSYTVQATLDDPNSLTDPVLPSAVVWINSSDANAVNATTSIQTNFAYAPKWVRILLNSGTGSVSATFTQFGNAVF